MKGLKFKVIVAFFLVLWCSGGLVANAEEEELSPKAFIMRAWEAWGAKDFEKTFYYTERCIERYSEKAKEEQAFLEAFPSTEVMELYEALNAVGTSFFIQGEAFLSQGKTDEAITVFKTVIEEYGYAQNWDP
ncbi:MAG: hypothetical protein KKG01_00275, partial [Candidatus Omnitrophica bacterium]|nr:hypothetical protein [Candidatus Omnitrophota bacterium]